MHRPRLDHRRRALAAACFLLPTRAALATTYDLSNQTIYLTSAPYTADDTLNCTQVTFSGSNAIFSPALNLVAGTTTVSISGNAAFAGPLSGSAAFTKGGGGAGTLTLSAPSPDFTGPVTLALGATRLTDPLALGPASAPTPITLSSTLDVSGSLPARPLLLSRGILTNDSPTPVTFGPSLSLAGSAHPDFTLSGAGDITFATPLPTAGSLTKTGTGTLTYSVPTSFAGSIALSAGTLRLGTADALATSVGLSINAGATLDLNGFSNPAKLPYIDIATNGSTVVNDNTASPSTLSRFPIGGTPTLGGAGDINLTARASSFTKTGAGTLTLSATNSTFSGTLTLNDGTVKLNAASALGNSTSSRFNLNGTTTSAGALDLNGLPAPAGTYAFNGGALVNNNTSTAVTLSTMPALDANTHDPSFGGDGTMHIGFFNFPSNANFHKVGSGLLTLPSNTSGIGASLVIHDGLVQIEADAQLRNTFGDFTVLDGGGIRVGPLKYVPQSTYTLTHDIAINPTGGTIDTLADTVLTGRITTYTHPSGTLTKTGPANLSLNWSGGAFIYNQPITVDQGTLSVNYPAYCLSQTPLTLNADNALAGSTSFTLGALAGTGALNNFSITTGALNLSTTYSGAFTNGALHLTGTGTLTLTGPATGSNFDVASGTLQIGDGGTAGSAAGVIGVSAAGQLTFNRADSFTCPSALYGTGTLTKLGAGTLTLTHSTTGLKLNVQAGSLVLAPSITPVPTSLTIAPAASLDLTSNDLIFNYAGPSPIAAIRQYLAAHQLFSSTADADPGHLTTLALTEASALLHLTGSQTATWSGQTVDATSLLLQPALFGDANLDGVVNPDDYTLLDRAYARSTTDAHWTDGDFNYDGTITSDDYLLIDVTYLQQQGGTPSPAFLSQRESQFGPAYVSTLLAAVPEPSSLFAACGLALPLLTRRRRQR